MSDQSGSKYRRGRQHRYFPGRVILSALVSVIVASTSALLIEVAANINTGTGPAYEDWASEVGGSWYAWFMWVIGDFTEPSSFKSPLASLGFLLGSAIAFLLWKKRASFSGIPLCYGLGDRFPWLIGSVILSLLITNIIFRDSVSAEHWQPTFVVVASVPASLVLLYGTGWVVLLTSATLGFCTVPFLSLVITRYVCSPLSIPDVIGIVSAMALGGAISCAVCRLLPWMNIDRHLLPSSNDPSRDLSAPGLLWVPRRILADFSEAQFIGNEWSGGLMLIGAYVGFYLNPAFAGYGSELLPKIVTAQVLSSAVGIVLWYRWFRDDGWAATYVPIVSVAPMSVTVFGGALGPLILGSLLGGVLGAPVARYLSRFLKHGFHPYIANVSSMGVCTLVTYFLLAIVF